MSKVLVIGGTGRTGRHIVDGLLRAGMEVRALVRHPPTADLPEEVAVVEGSIQDRAAVEEAATGADAAFLLWPAHDAAGAADVVETLAARAGHIVYLSAAQLQRDRSGVMDGVFAEVEAAIAASGATWTFLRAGGFAANTLEWAEQIRMGDVVRIPVPDAARPLVHERDLADAAVRALLEPGLVGGAFELTGDEALTQRRQVAELGAALGRDLRVEEQPPEEARAKYAAVMGDDFAEHALAHWASLVEDPEEVRDGVREILGRPPRRFSEWAREHRADFTRRTTAEVAHAYRDALGRGDMRAARGLLSDDIVRIAPLESEGREEPVKGVAAITDNAARQMEDVSIDAVEVGSPMVGGERFALRIAFSETERATGRRRRTVKLSLCTVHAGRIVREEVFYYEHPQSR
jgi:uncharacterized protein YbjT (DUF2867 family)/ketosteroid isomerase-like protein